MRQITRCSAKLGLSPVLIAVWVAISLLFTLASIQRGWAASKFRVLYAFPNDLHDGTGPNASLAFDAAGNLYSTTGGGGTRGAGTIFKLTHEPDGSWTQSVLYSITGEREGFSAGVGFAIDRAGNLYATTDRGGDGANGTLFQLTSQADETWIVNVLYAFGYVDGGRGHGGIAFDPEGNLYGTARGRWDYGSVYRLTPSLGGSWNLEGVYGFGLRDGAYPPGSSVLTFDAGGNVYGTTSWGGYGYGVVYRLSRNLDGTWKDTILHNFTAESGGGPGGRLAFDGTGNLYGIAGGSILFKLTPDVADNWTYKVAYRFRGGSDGVFPDSVLVDKSGSLYGTSYSGGRYGAGCVFKLSPAGGDKWIPTILHSFTGGDDGMNPFWFALDPEGTFFGTAAGGSGGGGVVYMIRP